jgi:hypothetical protein
LIFAIAIALLEFYAVVPKEHTAEPNDWAETRTKRASETRICSVAYIDTVSYAQQGKLSYATIKFVRPVRQLVWVQHFQRGRKWERPDAARKDFVEECVAWAALNLSRSLQTKHKLRLLIRMSAPLHRLPPGRSAPAQIP